MTNLSKLERWLSSAVQQGRPPLFQAQDLRVLFPDISENAYRALLYRAHNNELIEKICQGIYQDARHPDLSGYLLYRTAALLRAQHFNYISLESALSDAGAISQILMNWVTIISTGRSAIVDCGQHGKIEFVKTERDLNVIDSELNYDEECHLFRASQTLALEDMKRYGRTATGDLVDAVSDHR